MLIFPCMDYFSVQFYNIVFFHDFHRSFSMATHFPLVKSNKYVIFAWTKCVSYNCLNMMELYFKRCYKIQNLNFGSVLILGMLPLDSPPILHRNVPQWSFLLRTMYKCSLSNKIQCNRGCAYKLLSPTTFIVFNLYFFTSGFMYMSFSSILNLFSFRSTTSVSQMIGSAFRCHLAMSAVFHTDEAEK